MVLSTVSMPGPELVRPEGNEPLAEFGWRDEGSGRFEGKRKGMEMQPRLAKAPSLTGSCNGGDASQGLRQGSRQGGVVAGAGPRSLRHSGSDSETEIGLGFRTRKRSRFSRFYLIDYWPPKNGTVFGPGIRDRFRSRNPGRNATNSWAQILVTEPCA